MLARILPEIQGLMPVFFLAVLALLAVAVGVFALYVVAQQFRNPGRR